MNTVNRAATTSRAAEKKQMTITQIDRKIERFFDAASFPTPASEAEYARLQAERKLACKRLLAPRLVKKGGR